MSACCVPVAQSPTHSVMPLSTASPLSRNRPSTAARVLLLQIRDAADPMRSQEVRCFQEALGLASGQLTTFDLTGRTVLKQDRLKHVRFVVIGGSGNYSVAEGGPWWNTAAESLQRLADSDVPVFASCWGFQAIARVLGGEVRTDLSRAEVGTISVRLTDAARQDPVFSALPDSFPVQAGHQDVVHRLPDAAVRLAGSELVRNQAMKITDRPIYGTQFHPELTRSALIERIRAYPQYIERIAGIPFDEFVTRCRDTPESASLLQRFAARYAS